MLKIGDFSKLSRISIRMLRHYDQIGLLTPVNTDDFTSYRYYSETQLPIANRIKALKNMGFSLAAIGEIIKNYDDSEALARFLTVKQAEVRMEAQEVKQRLLLLETAITWLRKDETMIKYDVTIKTLPQRTVASVRKVIPAYDQEGMLWNTLMKETASLKMQDDDPSYTIAMFHDCEYKEFDVDVEVQKSIKGNFKNTENVVFKTEPAVEIASTICKGSYEQMNKVNEAVANWVQANGYEFGGAMFNIYYISPNESQNPDDYITEVCYPVKKK